MNEKYKHILVTGGAGRLGRQVYYALKDDYDVTLFDLVAPENQPQPWKLEFGAKGVLCTIRFFKKKWIKVIRAEE